MGCWRSTAWDPISNSRYQWHHAGEFFNQNSGSALGLVDLFSGGNLRKLTIFALGIMPYITASIIFQLLTVIYEPLAKLQKEGEGGLGRRKITQWTRYVTVLLGIVQIVHHRTHAYQYLYRLFDGHPFRAASSFRSACLPSPLGTAFIVWLGEQIAERGIGNGMSLLIFSGIVVGVPKGIAELYDKVQTNAWEPSLHRGRHPDRRHDHSRRLHRLCRAL